LRGKIDELETYIEIKISETCVGASATFRRDTTVYWLGGGTVSDSC
jgi:hypothetical protein